MATKRSSAKKAKVGNLPAKAVSPEKARGVKGGLKMLTSANEAASEAKNLASGIKKSQ